LVHYNDIKVEVYEADMSLVDEYEVEEEETSLEDLQLVDPIGTQVEANLYVADSNHIQTVTILKK